MKQRDLGLDLVKLLAIYFVVLGHVVMFVEKKSISQNWLYTFIYSFHMPLFMTISGYFAKSSLKRELFPFIKGKFKQLILPALTCTVICCIYFFCARGQTNFRYEIIGNSWFFEDAFCLLSHFLFVKEVGAQRLVAVRCFVWTADCNPWCNHIANKPTLSIFLDRIFS